MISAVTEDHPRTDPKPEFFWIWRAWHRLAADRPQNPFGMIHPMNGGIIATQPGATPWRIVRSWADHHGLTREEYQLLDLCIVAMDRVAHDHWEHERRKFAL
ncbi:hypothetical protein [Sorlinia euscelidii]|uniref:hypothetical protein n=1 Tax=Sorlinia euscelidii TaxID=3081148 RepID=UPI00374E163A